MTTKPTSRNAGFAARTLALSVRVLLLGFLGVSLASLAVLIVVPRATEGTALSVLTGSMTPEIPVGSVVLVRPVDTASLEVGDIATYQKAPDEEALITHRIVAIDTTATETSFTFKGDANQKNDHMPVPAEAIRGEVWFHVPYLGSIRDAFQGIAGLGLLAVLLLGGYAVSQFAGAAKDRRRTASRPPGFTVGDGSPIASDLPLIVARIRVAELAWMGPVDAALQFGGILVADDGETCTVMIAGGERASDVIELLDLFSPISVTVHEPPHVLAVQPGESVSTQLAKEAGSASASWAQRIRDPRRMRVVGGALVAVAILVTGAGSQATSALFFDFASVPVQAGAGGWTPDPQVPTECGQPKNYKGVVTGTEGDDDLDAGNGKQIVFGLGGDDVIRGGNGKDCLVGGDNDDLLVGGNGKDVMIGGDGDDTCSGGRAPDTYTCEHANEVDNAGEPDTTSSHTADGNDREGTTQAPAPSTATESKSSRAGAVPTDEPTTEPSTESAGEPTGEPTDPDPSRAPTEPDDTGKGDVDPGPAGPTAGAEGN